MSNSTGQSANGFHLLRLGECSLRCPKRLGAFRHARFQGLIELAERFRASRALGHVIAYLPLPPACPQRRADRTGQAHGVEGPLQKNDIPEHLCQMQLRNHAACCRPATGKDDEGQIRPGRLSRYLLGQWSEVSAYKYLIRDQNGSGIAADRRAESLQRRANPASNVLATEQDSDGVGVSSGWRQDQDRASFGRAEIIRYGRHPVPRAADRCRRCRLACR